jgi:hypothetical protein
MMLQSEVISVAERLQALEKAYTYSISSKGRKVWERKWKQLPVSSKKSIMQDLVTNATL